MLFGTVAEGRQRGASLVSCTWVVGAVGDAWIGRENGLALELDIARFILEKGISRHTLSRMLHNLRVEEGDAFSHNESIYTG